MIGAHTRNVLIAVRPRIRIESRYLYDRILRKVMVWLVSFNILRGLIRSAAVLSRDHLCSFQLIMWKRNTNVTGKVTLRVTKVCTLCLVRTNCTWTHCAELLPGRSRVSSPRLLNGSRWNLVLVTSPKFARRITCAPYLSNMTPNAKFCCVFFFWIVQQIGAWNKTCISVMLPIFFLKRSCRCAAYLTKMDNAKCVH